MQAEAGPQPTGCVGDACPCTVDADCKEPSRSRCSPEKKVCVECLSSPDTCPPGSYCNEASQCALGCKGNDDCKISPDSPLCNLTRHQCVECLTSADCGDAALLCSPGGSCVEGCDLDAGKTCPTGKSCCDNLCIDTRSDPLNCGSCENVCVTTNGTPRCSSGNCAWTCASGFAHCQSGNTGSETNIRTDVTRCGSCTRNCNTTIRNANNVTCNAYTSCKPGFGNCDGVASNGCECACGNDGQPCCPNEFCNAPYRCLGPAGGKVCK